ncbi:putative trans-resveratrol di-O-methyltransferase-like [Capsicum annuum]|nr:putative trans-resveratrol di-O-methyltransferase-like [Capsicum annuum]
MVIDVITGVLRGIWTHILAYLPLSAADVHASIFNKVPIFVSIRWRIEASYSSVGPPWRIVDRLSGLESLTVKKPSPRSIRHSGSDSEPLFVLNSGVLKGVIWDMIFSATMSLYKGGESTIRTSLEVLVIGGFDRKGGVKVTSMAVQSGFLNQHEDHFSLTPSSRLLAKNEPFNVRSLLLLNHGLVFSKAWPELSAWFQNDSPTPFHAAYEKSLWDYIEEEEPRVLGDIFNDALASDSRLNTNVLITECKHVFEGLTSLVDVGGDLKGGGNLEFVAGDMFDQIPHANATLLKCVLHDWMDEDCVKILKKCKESIPSREKRGKVIIIDTVLDDPKKSNEFGRAQHNMDMLMMVLYAAKERTKKEWEKLFIESGFTEYKIVPALGLRSLIEIYP